MERKLTDDEVITELKSASKWFVEHGRNTNTAIIGICDRAVDLINRQKAEIEEKSNKLREILPIVAELKSEAIKEFTERLKEKAYLDGAVSITQELVVDVRDIDTLVEEMTEDGE